MHISSEVVVVVVLQCCTWCASRASRSFCISPCRPGVANAMFLLLWCASVAYWTHSTSQLDMHPSHETPSLHNNMEGDVTLLGHMTLSNCQSTCLELPNLTYHICSATNRSHFKRLHTCTGHYDTSSMHCLALT